MTDAHLYTELVVDMLCQMLGGINAAMLTTSTSETEHQRCEPSLDITAYVVVGKFVDTVEEGEYLTVVLKETDYGIIKAREFLIRLITAWVMGTTAVEHISSAIARLIFWNPLGI